MLSPPRTAIKRFKKGEPTAFGEGDWSPLEEILGRGLPNDVRSEITAANHVFAIFGGLHSSANTVSVKAVDKAIDAWYKASGRLLLEIGSKPSVKKISRKKFLQLFSDQNAKRFKRMQPISALHHALSACMGISLTVADELSDGSSSSVLGPDMWRAWVCLIAKAMTRAGVRISASSSNKGTQSAFVQAIEHLHKYLPKACRRYNGYESVAKEIQKARKKFEKSDETYLRLILGGYGSNLVRNYGHEAAELVDDLSKMSSDEWRKYLEEKMSRVRREKRRSKGV